MHSPVHGRRTCGGLPVRAYTLCLLLFFGFDSLLQHHTAKLQGDYATPRTRGPKWWWKRTSCAQAQRPGGSRWRAHIRSTTCTMPLFPASWRYEVSTSSSIRPMQCTVCGAASQAPMLCTCTQYGLRAPARQGVLALAQTHLQSVRHTSMSTIRSSTAGELLFKIWLTGT